MCVCVCVSAVRAAGLQSSLEMDLIWACGLSCSDEEVIPGQWLELQ